MTENPVDFGAALEGAVRRALRNSKTEALAPRGGYYGIKKESCTFSWSGEIPDQLNQIAVQEFVQNCVDRSFDAEQITEYADLNDLCEMPLSEIPSEVVDWRRRSAALQRYVIPRYDTGDSQAVPVEDAEEGRTVLQRPVFAPVSLYDFEGEQMVFTFMGAGINMPFEGLQAVIGRKFRTANEYLVVFGRYMGMQNGEHQIRGVGLSISNLFSYRWAVNRDTGVFERESNGELPPIAGTVHLLTFGSDPVANANLLEPLVESSIETAFQDLPHPETMTRSEIATATNEFVVREVRARADRAGSNCKVVVIQNSQGSWVIGNIALTDLMIFESDTQCPYSPILAYEELTSEGDGNGGNGGGSGSGRGGRGAGSGSASEPGSGERGTGPGGGNGNSGGGVMFTGTDGSGNATRLFPRYSSGGGVNSCEAYQGEPSCEEIGEAANDVKALIDRIAQRLDMEPCYYAANFCIMAAQQIQGLAMEVGHFAVITGATAVTEVRDRGSGPGEYRFRPTATPAVQLMRHLGTTVALTASLSRMVLELYDQPGIRERVIRDWFSNDVSWQLHFHRGFSPEMDNAVARIFEQSCRVVLLQMLEDSRVQIQRRLDNIAVYAPFFENMIVHWLRTPTELMNLRSILRWRHVNAAADALADTASGLSGQWMSSARRLSQLFDTAPNTNSGVYSEGTIVEHNGVTKIADSHGRLWTAEELDAAVVTQRGLAEDLDPLVKQIRDLPDIFERFQNNPSQVRSTLETLLREMLANNTEMKLRTGNDPMFAFKASTIQDSIAHATIRGTSFALGGIHLAVHEMIQESFLGTVFYARGVDYALTVQSGKNALTDFGIAVGLIVLTVLCPPAGFLAGVGVATYEVGHAYMRDRLYGSLINPDLVLSRAEVEVGIFVAWLGFVLSAVPEGGTALRAGFQGARVGMRVGTRVGLRAGIGAGTRSAARYVARRAVREMLEAASRDILDQFVQQLVMDRVFTFVIERAMTPLISQYQSYAATTSAVGGTSGAQAIVQSLAAGSGPGENAATRVRR
jgi:hypothetical protein